MQPKPGDEIEEFILRDYIGTGGFGVVFRAYDQANSIEVAIKLLHSKVINSKVIETFEQEAKILRKLNHPNIVQFRGFRKIRGSYCLIMDYVPGGSLRKQLIDGRVFSVEEVIRIGGQLCSALDAVHSLGVIHRDMKPENIIFDGDGNVKITDFGVSYLPSILGGLKENFRDAQPGTLVYMSPSQAIGKEVLRSTDIYALGVILFEMLTNTSYIDFQELQAKAKDVGFYRQQDFQAVLIKSIVERIVERRRPKIRSIRPAVPVWLENVIIAAIEERISARFLETCLNEQKDSSSLIHTKNSKLSRNELFMRLRPLIYPPFVEDQAMNKRLGISGIMNNLPNKAVDFAPFLRIYLAIDSDKTMSFLEISMLARLRLDFEQAYTMAKRNLEKSSRNLNPEVIHHYGRPIAIAFNEGDGYDAARILILKKFHNMIQKTLMTDNYVVGIPDRDLLIVFLPLAEIVRSMQKKIREQTQLRRKPITDKLFMVNGSGAISIFDEVKNHE